MALSGGAGEPVQSSGGVAASALVGQRIAVTGATGYIGRRFVAQARALGYELIELGRRPTLTGVPWLALDLLAPDQLRLPEGLDALVHLAAITAPSGTTQEAAELESAERLVAQALGQGTVVLFVSSQTASPTAPTAYGRLKWEIERAVLAAGGWAVRPGLVYGGVERGLFGVLVATLRRTRLVPRFLPAPGVAPIHVDDLVEGLLRVLRLGLAQRREAPIRSACPGLVAARPGADPEGLDGRERLFRLGAEQPMAFADFLRLTASVWLRRRVLGVPVPALLPRLGAALLPAEWGISTALRRLVSLLDLPPLDSKADLAYLGLRLREPALGLNRSGDGRRRALLAEGQALLTFALGEPPRGPALRRYLRAIETLRDGVPMGLPDLGLAAPALIGGLEGPVAGSPWRAELIWRIDAATALAEASPQGARRFLALGDSSGLLASLWMLARSVARELLWRILRPGVRILERISRMRGIRA